MPTTVRKRITAADLRTGDILEETPPAVVESLTRHVTRGVVQIAGETKPRRLRLDADVIVLREEPTEQEQAQRRRTMMVEILKGDPGRLAQARPGPDAPGDPRQRPRLR
ncbi:hypothetical protein [Dactylosporangium sp. CA-092794]|uniref:hypothetical protein n=1 Tax=Dactylosporangium sp. CA-092794 TaxID=3239929 RepID=UPI003D9327D3